MGSISGSVKFCKNLGLRMWEKSLSRSNHFSQISDDGSFEKKKEVLKQAELLLGFDFTRTNNLSGQASSEPESLHQISEGILNPYQQLLTDLGRIFQFLRDKNKPIACYGFGDSVTRDDDVFGFNPQNRPCAGIEEALARYVNIVPDLYLADPLSFAPVINMAISTVERNQGKHHVLVVISNGPVHRDIRTGKLSRQEQKTIDAIEAARGYSLSIILIGVGDKTADMMRFFEDNLSPRALKHFQVVDYTKIMSQEVSESKKEMEFALAFMKKLRSN